MIRTFVPEMPAPPPHAKDNLLCLQHRPSLHKVADNRLLIASESRPRTKHKNNSTLLYCNRAFPLVWIARAIAAIASLDVLVVLALGRFLGLLQQTLGVRHMGIFEALQGKQC